MRNGYINIVNVRIAVVIDHRNAAFDNVVSCWKKQNLEFEIFYFEDYSSPASLLSLLELCNAEIVHFMWRKWIYDFTLNHETLRQFAKLKNRKIISTHIADYLYLELDKLEITKTILNLTDSYFTVSKDLFEKYNAKFPGSKPQAVVNDLVDPQFYGSAKRKIKSGTLNLLWVGNSRWGEWYGKLDAKGLNSILKPTVERISNKFNVNLKIVDSSIANLTKETLRDLYKNSDVLLMTSLDEGSPLPVMEAASSGVAVISTRTGSIFDWCGRTQREFVIDRNPDSFIKAITKLHRHRDLLAKLQNENSYNYAKFYSANSKAIVNYFKKVQKKNKDKSIISDLFLDSMQDMRVNTLVQQLYSWTYYRARKSTIARRFLSVKKIHNIAKFIQSRLHMHSNSQTFNRELSALMMVDKMEERTAIAFYDPRWKGVGASTNSIFMNSVALPINTDNHHANLSKEFLDELIRILIQKLPKRIVISGGDEYQFEIVRRIRDVKSLKNTKLSLLWHSSTSYLAIKFDSDTLGFWINKYRLGLIDSIDVVDSNMSEVLEKLEVESITLCNGFPQDLGLVEEMKRKENISPNGTGTGPTNGTGTGPLRALIPTAKPEFRKNSETALAALLKLELFSEIVLIGDNGLYALISRENNVQNGKLSELGRRISFIHPLQRLDFLKLLSDVDLVVYTTFAEASPMVPLEALYLGIPIVTGPSVPYLADFPNLRDLCVVQDPNDVKMISAKIERLMRNRNLYSKLAKDFKRDYGKKQKAMNSKVYKLSL